MFLQLAASNGVFPFNVLHGKSPKPSSITRSFFMIFIINSSFITTKALFLQVQDTVVKYYCKNCRNSFETEEEADACPRCSSKYLEQKHEVKKETTSKRFYTKTGVVYGDTKNAWKSYHSNRDVKQCSKCGSDDFENNYRRRERICRKCGEIYPLPRSG